MNDVRFVKDDVARAPRTLRAATSPEPGYRIVSWWAQMVGLRSRRRRRPPASRAESRRTRDGLGWRPELTSRGASTKDVMLAGNWKRRGW